MPPFRSYAMKKVSGTAVAYNFDIQYLHSGCQEQSVLTGGWICGWEMKMFRIAAVGDDG